MVKIEYELDDLIDILTHLLCFFKVITTNNKQKQGNRETLQTLNNWEKLCEA